MPSPFSTQTLDTFAGGGEPFPPVPHASEQAAREFAAIATRRIQYEVRVLQGDLPLAVYAKGEPVS